MKEFLVSFAMGLMFAIILLGTVAGLTQLIDRIIGG